MKKYLLSILFLLAFCRLGFAGSISVDAFLTGDDVTIAHLETLRSTFQGAINSADGGLIQVSTITAAKLDANTNPENRWNETFNDFVYTGLTIPESTDLESTTTSGIAYIEGVRVVKDATLHEYIASKHTYVDLSKTGTYTYTPVAINADAPSVADNSIRLAIVSTDTTKVLSVEDERVTTVAFGEGAVTSISDTDEDTKIQVEESSDEDIIRFDTAGTERVIIDSNGLKITSGNLKMAGSSSGTLTVTVSADTGTNTITLPAETGTVYTSATANAVDGVVTVGAVWADYFSTSTIAGWAATPTGKIYYKKIGKIVFVAFNITGTSNATGVSFTLPYTADNIGINYGGILNWAIDNGVTKTNPSAITLSANSNNVYCYLDLPATPWTASGTKTVAGQFWFEVP